MSETPSTDAAIIDFEYSYAGYGGETLGSEREIIEPDFCRSWELLARRLATHLRNIPSLATDTETTRLLNELDALSA